MIPTTPDSKPIECSPDDELLAMAYSIIRQTRHYLNLLEPSVTATADLKSTARDFCLTFETRFRPAPGVTLWQRCQRFLPPLSRPGMFGLSRWQGQNL